MKPLQLLLLTFLFPAVLAFAQNEPAADEPPSDTEGISRTEKVVNVIQDPGDVLIAQRLTRILNVTGWVENLKVSVQEGVVNLKGTVAKKSQSEWAEKLAHDTAGVIAVTNELETKHAPWFDLKPAKEETEGLAKSIVGFFPYLLLALVVLAIFFYLASFANKFGRRAAQKRVSNPILVEIIAKLVALPVILIGMYLVLRMSGLTGMAMTILGGTGAAGLIVGFALQNILSNYFSGIMLSVRNPFKVGDVIDVDGKTGVVQKLTTRGTILVDFDGNHIIIPNSTVYEATLTNMSANPSMRVTFPLLVAYKENIKSIRDIILKGLSGLPEVLQNPEPLVMVEDFTENGIRIKVYFWIDAVKSSGMKMKSKAMEMVKIDLQKAGIVFPGAQRFLLVDHSTKEEADSARGDHHDENEVLDESATHAENEEVLEQAQRGRHIDHGNELI